MRFLHGILLTSLLVFASHARAESAGGLSWETPQGWKSDPKPMRAANYSVPAAPGDSEPGELAIFYFGPGQGGGVDANVKRWIGQFQAPDGGPAGGLAKRSKKTVNGIQVDLLHLTGIYLFKPFPMAPQATPKPGYRMLAAIAEGSDAPVFFKLTGPKKTVDAAEEGFNKLVESLRRE